MKNVKHITKAQAVVLFENFNKEVSATGVTFGSISYLVDESKSKTVNKEKLIKKHVTTQVTFGSNYGAKVNRIAENKQGEVINFVPEAPKGKEYYIDGAPIMRDIATGEKRYLMCIVENHVTPQTQYYIADGMKPVSREEIWNEDFITPAGLKPSTYTAGRGAVDVENDFKVITPDFKNIKGFKVNGIDYLIID